jgi:regulator of protease activity HflC (stomatin/prohibitin superfamily)
LYNVTSSSFAAVRPAALQRPAQPAQAASVSFSGNNVPAPQFAGKRANGILWGGGILAGFMALLSPFCVDINKPGQHSIVVNSLSPGKDKTVYGPGPVMTFPPFFATNYPIDTTIKTVKEVLVPHSKDGTPIDKVELELSFQVDPGPEGKYESVNYILSTLLGSDSKRAPEGANSSTEFYSEMDEVSTRLYYSQIQQRLHNSVKTISTLFKADGYHHSREFMTKALNEGYKGTYKDQEGVEREISIDSLKDQLAPYGIKITLVRVSDIDLPDYLEAKRQEQALYPIREANARLQKEANEAEGKAKAAFQMIEASANEEKAKGQAAYEQKLAEGKVAVANERARLDKIKAKGAADAQIASEQGKAAALLEEKTGEATAQQEVARGISEAAKLKAEGESQAAILKGNAAATVAEAEGLALKNNPQLLEKQRIEAEAAARKAMATNAKIVVVDPKTGLNMRMLNVTGGANPLDLRSQILGQTAAKELTEPTQQTPPTPPPAPRPAPDVAPAPVTRPEQPKQ